MTTRSRNPHVSPVDKEPERRLRILKATSADSATINEAQSAACFSRDRRVDYL